MKRSLIALGVAAAVSLPVAANAAPKVYGKLNVTAESYKKEFNNGTADTEQTQLVSNASRFGVKGEDELTANLSAVYLIEWQVAADDGIAAGGKTDLTQRNRYIGIKHADLGTLKLGKYDSYLKQAQGEIDLFNDYFGDLQYVIGGENRLNNVIGYESPKILDGLTFNVLVQTQEAQNDTSIAARKNGSSTSIVYNNEELGLYAALAADKDVFGASALFGNRESDNLRAVVSGRIAEIVTLSAIWGQSKDVTNGLKLNNDEAGWQVGASVKLGDELLKAQYGEAEADDSKAATQKHTLWSVGVDHNFTSKTAAAFWYSEKNDEKLVASGDTKERSIALGLSHKF